MGNRERIVCRFWVIAACCASLAGILELSACSSGVPASSGADSKMYESQDLESFVEDSAETPMQEYVIGIGDLLDVVFVYNVNLNTRSVPVRRDGRISLPYVGDQIAAGRTPMELDSILTQQYAEILRDPSLTVIIKKEATRLVYVLGQVSKPGGYPYENQISLVQAIAEAGGPLKSAKTAHTVLIRREGLDKIVGVEIDVKSILNGSAIENDIMLRRYDIVYVPKSPIYTVGDFAREVNEIIGTPLGIVLTGWQIRTLQANYEYFHARRTLTD